MPKTKAQKQNIVKSYKDKIDKSKALVFINFKGLKVKDIESFRKKCREGGAEYMVAKKTLMAIAFKDSKISIDPKSFDGDIGCVFGLNDEVFSATVAAHFSKDHDAMKILGGILEKKFIDANRVMELSRLPSRKELLGKLVGSIRFPISGFVNVLAGNLKGLLRVLRAIQEDKCKM